MINRLKRKTGSASLRGSGRISMMQGGPATQNDLAYPATCDLTDPVFLYEWGASKDSSCNRPALNRGVFMRSNATSFTGLEFQ